MSKTLTGQAKRNADIEKARSLVQKARFTEQVEVLESAANLLPGVGLLVDKKPVSATSDDKKTLSDPSKVVEQKPKKASVKKPTAKQLGVGQVVGGRGKVRSESPVVIAPEPSKTAAEIRADFQDWFEEQTAYHADQARNVREALKYYRNRRLLQFCQVGTVVIDRKSTAIVMANHGGVIDMKTVRGHESWAPATEVELYDESEPSIDSTDPILVREETAEHYIIREKKPTPLPSKIVKPRGEGWNGYSSSAIFRWAGNQGWTKEDCLKTITVLGLTGVQEKSLPTLLKAGKDGFRLPDMQPEHAAELNAAAGKTQLESQTRVLSKK